MRAVITSCAPGATNMPGSRNNCRSLVVPFMMIPSFRSFKVQRSRFNEGSTFKVQRSTTEVRLCSSILATAHVRCAQIFHQAGNQATDSYSLFKKFLELDIADVCLVKGDVQLGTNFTTRSFCLREKL